MAWSFIGYNQKLKKTMNQLKDITGAKIVLLHFSSIKVREVLLETKQVFCNLTEFEMICESQISSSIKWQILGVLVKGLFSFLAGGGSG